MKPDLARRLTDSVETAAGLSGGLVILNELEGDRDTMFSQNYACEDCGVSLPELSPRMFSFNNPYGACPVCTGLGTQLVADPALVIPDAPNPSCRAPFRPAATTTSVTTPSRGCTLRRSGKISLLPDAARPRAAETALNAILYGTGKEISRSITSAPTAAA